MDYHLKFPYIHNWGLKTTERDLFRKTRREWQGHVLREIVKLVEIVVIGLCLTYQACRPLGISNKMVSDALSIPYTDLCDQRTKKIIEDPLGSSALGMLHTC